MNELVSFNAGKTTGAGRPVLRAKMSADGGSSNDKFYANDGAVDVIFGGKGNDLATIDASKDILNSVETMN